MIVATPSTFIVDPEAKEINNYYEAFNVKHLKKIGMDLPELIEVVTPLQ